MLIPLPLTVEVFKDYDEFFDQGDKQPAFQDFAGFFIASYAYAIWYFESIIYCSLFYIEIPQKNCSGKFKKQSPAFI